MVSWWALRHSPEEVAAACSSNHSKPSDAENQTVYGEDVVPASAATASGFDPSEHESLQRNFNVRVL